MLSYLAGSVIWENMTNELNAVLHARVMSVYADLDLHSTVIAIEICLFEDSNPLSKDKYTHLCPCVQMLACGASPHHCSNVPSENH